MLLHPSCRFACSSRVPSSSSLEVSTECPDCLMWKIGSITAVTLLVLVLTAFYCSRKKIYQRIPFPYKKTEAGPAGGDGDEQNGMNVNYRAMAGDDEHLGNIIVEPQLNADVDIRNPQQNQEEQRLLANTDGNFQIRQRPSSDTINEGIPHSSDASRTNSQITLPSSSASSPSISSASTESDSGVNSPRSDHVDHLNLVQQSPQTGMISSQRCGNDQHSHIPISTSIPDAGSEVVTNLSQYKERE